MSAALCSFEWAETQPVNAAGAQEVIGFLNTSIDWYRQLVIEEQAARDPSEVIFVNDDRETATEILRLSFDFARADAQVLAGQAAGSTQTATSGKGKYANLVRSTQQADSEAQQTKAELDSDKGKLAAARGAARKKLQSEIDELQSELDLAQIRSTALHNVLQFVSGASGTSGNLSDQIDQLEHSVPELESERVKAPNPQNRPSTTTSPASTATTARRERPSGILSLVEDLFSLSQQIRTIDRRIQSTDQLEEASRKIRTPLVANVATIAQRGEDAAKQAVVSSPDELEQLKHNLDALTESFKQAAGVVVPLSKQGVLFDLYKSNLARWRLVLKSDYSTNLRELLIRLFIFGFVLAFVIALAGIWQRAVFRYVRDSRRRYQFLLLRRILLWSTIGIIIAFTLASEIGSIATFAGLITAGIAVALQNVILAIAGYFFLIGKYGVRVGDRVQISGVTGDVIDIGLIRLHLIEVGGTETDRQPTGRVVVFSNAVVFQPTASFYKQIPGTSFVWHEVSLTLAPESDYAQAEKRVLAAVEKVYDDYKERIVHQHGQMQRNLNVDVPVPKPRSRLRLTQAGLEVVVRYPVELASSTEIDDRITREILHSLAQPPRLRLVGTGTPNIQPVSDEKAA